MYFRSRNSRRAKLASPLTIPYGGISTPKGGPAPPLNEAVRVVTNEEEVRKEIQELVAKKADFLKVWQDVRRELMPRPVSEFLIAEAHRNNLRVVAHTHALSDFKHLLRFELDALAHPTWRQTEVEPVDDELIALWKEHPDVPVMTSMWTRARVQSPPRAYGQAHLEE
jgi:hypothetical protein